MTNFANLKNGNITINNYRFVDAQSTTLEDLVETHRQEKDEYLTAIVDNTLFVSEIEKGNWSAFFTGIDGMDNLCFEEEGHNIIVNSEECALEEARNIWGITVE